MAGLVLGLGVAGGLVGVQAAGAAPAAVAGAMTSGDSLFPNQGNGGYDVTHYDIALSYINPAITATTTITAVTTGAPLSSYSLDFEGLTITALTVNGVTAPYTRNDQTGSTVPHKLIITPTTPVSGTFTTVVSYAGVPTTHVDDDQSTEGWNPTSDGAVFLNQPIGSMTGFPNNNTPSDRATYDLHISVPAVNGVGTLSAISNGVLASKTSTATATTWNWHEAKPMASELTLIAIGNFTEYTGSIDLGGGRTVPENTYVDALDADSTSGITAARAALPNTLRYINNVYGPYPGESTGILVDLATITYALETQDRPFFPVSVDDSTMTHEFTHQWFGDSVSPCDWNDIWMNEGPATFVPVEYDHVKDTAKPTTETTFFGLWSSTVANDSKWTIPPAAMTDSGDLFGWQVYNRGAMTLEALRAEVGDTLFHQIMREHLRRNAGVCNTTRTFINLTKELTGHAHDAELEAFFQDWLYQPDKPAWPSKFDLSLTSSPVTGSTVTPGAGVTYTLKALSTGKVSLAGAKVSTDVTSLQQYATITTPLPAGVTLTGSRLTWTVPTTVVGATATQPFTATIKPTAYAGNAVATASADTLGGTCTACTSTLRVDGPADPGATASASATTSTTPTGSPTASPTASSTATVTVTQTAPTATATVTQTAPTATATTTVTQTAPTATATATVTQTAPTVTATSTVTQTAPTVTATSTVTQTAPTATATTTVTQTAPTATATTTVTQTAPTATATTTVTQTAPTATATSTVTQTAPTATATTTVTQTAPTATVTVTAPAGSPTPTSTQTGTPSSSPTSTATPTAAPVPVVLGAPKVGGVLLAGTPGWPSGTSFSYQWLRDGAPIAGQTSPMLTLTAGDLGHLITLSVTGTSAGRSATTTSAATAPVAVGTQTHRGKLHLRGTPAVGSALTVRTRAFDPGARVSYRWFADGHRVGGAHGSRLPLTPALRGHRLRAKVTSTLAGYTTLVLRSRTTRPIR